MAKLKKKSRKLGETHLKYLLCMLLAYIMFAVCCVFGVVSLKNGEIALLGASVLFCVLFLWLGKKMHNNASIVASGLKGEQETGQLLKKLPAGYTAFQNINVSYKGKNSELDTVVVGKSGVFVIETKNSKGTISGGYQSQNWLQTKHRGTQTHEKTLYNPTKQVGTHVYRLANFLRDEGINVNVSAAVYFASPEAFLELSGEKGSIPVFAFAHNGERELLDYIKKGESRLTDSQIKKINKLLNR